MTVVLHRSATRRRPWRKFGTTLQPKAACGRSLRQCNCQIWRNKTMATHASWSPGIAFMPAEFPGDMRPVNGVSWSDALGLRQNGGTTFQGAVGTSNWFHVPIATPVIVAGTRAKLVQVFVMFRCGSAASIAANDATIAGCNIPRWTSGTGRAKSTSLVPSCSSANIASGSAPATRSSCRHRRVLSSASNWPCTSRSPKTNP
jgi:hypothetical protein